MDYDQKAQELLHVMHQMRKRKAHAHLSGSMQGENFILMYLANQEGDVIPSDLRTEMGITSARITAALNNLEKKGLISRKMDPDDRRKILLELTDKGRVQVTFHTDKMMRMTTNLLCYLGQEDAEEFVRIMKRLSDKRPEDFM